jgi:hypothetical protein
MSGFTFDAYGNILDELLAMGYKTLCVRALASETPDEPWILMRHDVEWGGKRALAFARMERDRGIVATYYFHGPHRRKVFDTAVMKSIAEMGHEIGYHYETLDLTGGDFQKAEELFAEQLEAFRQNGIPIDTVCMHGNPRIKKEGYSRNADLFKDRLSVLRDEYDLLGEAYYLSGPDNPSYVSDVGIRFSQGWGESSTGFIETLRRNRPEQVYFLTHPDYWSRSPLRAFCLYWAGRLIRKAGINQLISRLRAARN